MTVDNELARIDMGRGITNVLGLIMSLLVIVGTVLMTYNGLKESVVTIQLNNKEHTIAWNISEKEQATNITDIAHNRKAIDTIDINMRKDDDNEKKIAEKFSKINGELTGHDRELINLKELLKIEIDHNKQMLDDMQYLFRQTYSKVRILESGNIESQEQIKAIERRVYGRHILDATDAE